MKRIVRNKRKNSLLKLAVLMMFVFFLTLSTILSYNFFSGKKTGGEKNPPVINKNIDLRQVYENLAYDCTTNDYSCIVHFLEDLTSEYGPKNALDILTLMTESGRIDKSISTHYLAHAIGESTAKTFGDNREAFLACPMEAYNGGCTHGYFELFTAERGSAQEAAKKICESLENDDFSVKNTVYCYHGIGHGILMSNNYDLNSTLDECDQFPSFWSQEGCLQGVFMEMVMGYQRGAVGNDYYSNSDIFSPCNKIDEKYARQCYLNHTGYMLNGLYNGSAYRTGQACATNSTNGDLCAAGLGPIITEESWIYNATGADTPEKAAAEAGKICNSFPASIVDGCYTGSIGNILNEDWPDITRRATKFCDTSTVWPKEECYRYIGQYITYLASDENSFAQHCDAIPQEFRSSCIEGTFVE